MNGFIVSSFWIRNELDDVIRKFDKKANVWTLILENNMNKTYPSTFLVFTELSHEQINVLTGIDKATCINTLLTSNPVLDQMNQVKEQIKETVDRYE